MNNYLTNKSYSALLILFFCFPLSVFGQVLLTDRNNIEPYQVELVNNQLKHPWGMAFLSADEVLITEKKSSLKLLNLSSNMLTSITGLPDISTHGQGGLMDVAVTDDYTAGDWIYFTYSKKQHELSVTTLARAKLNGSQLEQWQDLLITKSATKTGRHFGSRIAFDNKGHIFFSIGDRGKRPNGQKLSTHAGSILRLNLDGTVPEDNPFINHDGALPEIWSYGHRNPQGLAYDTQSSQLWAIEHGPRGGDEINLIKAGHNYGWPILSYGLEYSNPAPVGQGTEREGMESPIKVYIPSIAPSSLLMYSGMTFPTWKGNLFAGALALQHLNRVVLDQDGKAVDEQRLLESLNARIRAVIESPEGLIYLSTDDGRILRIKPVASK